MKPEELKYAKTHEWVHIDESSGDKIATLGISSFAIEQLNDLVYMELAPVAKQLNAGDSIGEIESVKAVSDVYSPIAGEVVESNEGLADNLDTLKDDAYGAGWLVKIKVSDDAGLAELMDHAAYEKQCAEEH